MASLPALGSSSPSKNLSDKGDIPWLKQGNLMEFFCELIDQNDQLIDSENLYCINCLQNQKTQAFENDSPYSILLEHLVVEHQMEPMTPVIVEEKNLAPAGQKLQYFKLGDKQSILANYYSVPEDGKGLIQCDMCTKNGLSSVFTKGSAHTILFRHLRMAHNIILPTAKANALDNDPPQRKNISTAWKYFCKITNKGQIVEDGFLYCGECLKKNIKKRYKSSTSTGTLSMHLQVHHNILSDELWNGSPVNRTRKFYKKRPHDPTHIYCRLCLKSKKYQKYKISTSTSTLKIHLESKHKLDPYDSDINFSSSSEKSSDEQEPNAELANPTEITKPPMTEEVCEDYTECMLCSDEGMEMRFIGSDREATLAEHLATVHSIHSEEKEEHLLDENDPIDYEPEVIQEPSPKSQYDAVETQEMETQGSETQASETQRPEPQELDFNMLCRSCGDKIDESTCCKFSETHKHGNLVTTLEQMYQEVTGIIPTAQEKLSQLICLSCKDRLQLSYAFKDQSLKVEALLIETLQAVEQKSAEVEQALEPPVQKRKKIYTEDNVQQSIDPLGFDIVPRETLPVELETLEEVNDESILLAVPVQNLPPTKKRKRSTVEHEQPPNPILSAEGTYDCNQCPKKFLNKIDLQHHVKTRHKFSCTDCHLGFATSMQLSAHTFSHSNSAALRPYACTVCDRKFCSQDVLKTHLKFVHDFFGDTTQQCKICNKVFTSKDGLSRHSKLHNGQYHPCTECGSKFSMLSALNVHKKTVHQNFRNFQCKDCPKSYKSNSHLVKHRESEHLKLKFYCKICDKSISGRWKFNAHIKAMHPEKVGNTNLKPNVSEV